MMPTAKCAIYLVLIGSALARPDGTGGHHDHGHHAEHAPAPVSAPASGYAEPAAAYSAPASAYGAPDPGYSAPASAYGAPDAGYSAPDAGYGAPDAGYGPPAYGSYEQTAPDGLGLPGIDLTTLLIPILIIAGLALLFPSTTTVAVTPKRKKRATEDEGPTSMERMVDIMEAVTTSEGCMERIACEVGGMADQAGMDKTMTRLAESFVSKKAQKLMKKFNGSEDCRKIKCGMF